MKKAEKIFYILCVLFFIWIAASFIDVNAHNMSDQVYASWNIFNVFD